MDIIGTMYASAEVEGQEPTALPGWHVNTPAPVPGWEAKQVTPATPMRVYAGHATYFYMFDSEEQFTEMAIAAGLISEGVE
jgi:hypothetical protein